MYARIVSTASAPAIAAVVSVSLLAGLAAGGGEQPAFNDGIVRVKSAHSLPETVARLQQEIAAKGIMMFLVVDQARLAGDAGIDLRPSTLPVFGNPALGSLFITSRPQAGLDWPVRLLVHEDEKGQVWAVYTDFAWIARRHGITNRQEAFKTASEVIASVTSSVKSE